MEKGYREKPNGLQYFSYGSDVAGNGSDVPLQIKHPEISWDWNWSNGKDFRSLEQKLYRGKITQTIGDSLSRPIFSTACCTSIAPSTISSTAPALIPA